jgi:pimeloyl-ACP methyl ester carboxylesterase
VRPQQVPFPATAIAGALFAAAAIGCGGGGHTTMSGSPASRASAPLRLQPCDVAQGARCGTLRVALDPARPGGRQLSLRVAVVGDRQRPVLLSLTGGPGQPGVPFLRRTRSLLGALADRFYVVMIDQRGTGAAALRCPALQRAMGTSDLTVPPVPAVRDCARRLGRGRAFYTTTQVVADLEALRRALQAGRMWIMGVSYGTYVAERYALAHPRNVAGLVLASVVPQTGVDATLQDNLRATARVLRAACGRCPTDPARDLHRALRRGADGPAVLDALTALSIAEPDFPGVPAALHRAAAGDRRRLDRLVAATRRAQAAPATVLSQGLHAATLCADSRLRSAARLTADRVWPFDPATAAHNGLIELCRHWPPTEPPKAALNRPLPPVPTLLLEGAADLSTTVSWMRQEARWTPNATIRVLPGVGHGVLRSPAGIRAVRAFLAGASHV